MTARVPEGMSSVDAFNALYKNANVIGMGNYAPSSGEPPKTPWNTVQIFKKYCPTGSCHYVRGKSMKVDFHNFPELNVENYDKQYGPGSAQKAIDTYQKTIKNSDPKYDLNCGPCTYFTSYWKERTPEDQRKDLDEKFSLCERLEKSEKKAEQQISETKSSSLFTQCKAKYTLVSSTSYVDHPYMPCQEALDHFKMLLQSSQQEDTNVVGLSVCRSIPFLPFLQKCQKQSCEVYLNTARKILESQTPNK